MAFGKKQETVPQRKIPIYTTDTVLDGRAVEYIGIVTYHVAKMAASELVETAFTKLAEIATAKGADAIVGVKVAVSADSTRNYVDIYGTAVKFI